MNIKKQDVTKLLFNKFVTSCFKLYYKFFLKNLGNKVNNLGEIISKSLFFMPPSKIKAIKKVKNFLNEVFFKNMQALVKLMLLFL